MTEVQIQAKTKPKIEEIIPEYLDGENEQVLIEFLKFCKTKWSATNRWKLKLLNGIDAGMIYIGKSPCVPGGENFEKNVWYIHANMAEDYIKEDIVSKNILPCQKKDKACRETVTILGKEYENICPASGRRFKNPDAETLDFIKKWLEHKSKLDKL